MQDEPIWPHPNATLSRNASENSPPNTISFLGTQPRSTQVPPAPPTESDATLPYGSSHTAALIPARAGQQTSPENKYASVHCTGGSVPGNVVQASGHSP